ncbi:MAG: TonB-dependent receptor [Pseudomonadales bacterium]|nr:TonB-dependent receptor [Pseudomonadales bacterium]
MMKKQKQADKPTFQKTSPGLFKKKSSICGLAVSLALSTLVHAQDGAQGTQAAGVVDEIQVTGSRIRRSGFETPTPVTTVGIDELSNMEPGTLVESLSQLPQFFGNTTPSSQGFFLTSPGAGNLNLRGLGTNRTLNLLDGRRLVPSSRLGSTDINILPEALISRVDLVTGGASAAYGTDAVAGVVNMVLNTEFTGVKSHFQGGATTRGDNENWEGEFSFGADLGERGHLLFSVDAFQQNQVESFDDRNWFQGYGTVTNPDPTGPRDLIAPNVVSTQWTFGGLINQPGSALNRLQFLSDGSATPFITSDLSAVNAGTFSQSIAPQFGGGSGDNIAADPSAASLAPSFERGSAFTYLDYDINDNVNVYVQGMYGNNKSNQPGGSALMFSLWQAKIFQDNAFLPENIRQIMQDEGLESFGFSRLASSADVATQRSVNENNTFSATTGFKATIDQGMFRGWAVDGYYQYGRNERRTRQLGWTRTDRVFLALDAVSDPATGATVCRSALLDPENHGNCVPINLFGAGNASQEALDFVTGQDDKGQTITTPLFFADTGFERGREHTFTTQAAKIIRANLNQHIFDFSANGPLWEGFGAGEVSAAIGATWRREALSQVVDDPSNPTSNTNLVIAPRDDPARGILGVPNGFSIRPTGFQFSTSPNLRGSQEVKEVFLETLVPLVSDVVGVQRLDVSLAGRWADYTGSGTIWAWKGGIDWQITDDLRVRATESRDVRAATLAERLDRQGQGGVVNDPEFNNQEFTVGVFNGGNPSVAPEKADTITLGMVYQPSFLPGASLSVDWYDIIVKGSIGQLTPQRIVDECFNGAQDLCAQIQRDSNNEIIEIENTFLNINKAEVKGVDVEMAYNTDVNLFGGGAEALRWRFFATWLDENSTTNLGAPKRDGAGETGLGSLPEFKITSSITYRNGPVNIFLQERWIDSGKLDIDEVEGIDINDNTVRGAFYTDLNLSYTIDLTNGGTWEIYGNLNNLFDENPPVVANFASFGGATQTNQSLFDTLGRSFTAGFRMQF